MNDYFKLPLEYIGITTYFSKEHPAIDLGWKNDPNPNIYSIAKGKVIENGYNDSTGYRVWIQTDINDIRYLHRYCHLKEKSHLKVGEEIEKWQKIGIMGTTGNSTGNHLHLDLWKCPKNYIMNWNDRLKYAVDPLQYCFMYNDQTKSSNSKNIINVLGTNLKNERNEQIKQVKIKNTYLRVRSSNELNDKNILGYIDLGIYNILDEKKDENYNWIKIDENMWVAQTNDVEILNDTKETIENEKNINNNLESFIAPKKGYYYIYLDENEQIFYKKKM